MQNAGIFRVFKNRALQIRKIQGRELQGLPVILIFQDKQLADAHIHAKIMEVAKLEMEEPLDHAFLIVLVEGALVFLVDVIIATMY